MALIVEDKKLKQVEEIRKTIASFIDDWSRFEYSYEVSEGDGEDYVSCEFTVEELLKGKPIETYYSFDVYDDRFEMNVYEDVFEELTEASFWRQMASQLSSKLYS